MALDFPTSPTNGQKYPASPVVGVPTYTWDGEKWTTGTATITSVYVAKAGDTMSGPLVLPSDPSTALQATTKQYVDARPSAITADTMPPTSSPTNSLWWESDTGVLHILYDDTTSKQWVGVSGPPGPPGLTGPTDWDLLTNKPATFPPTTPIAQADVTSLVTDLGLKAPLAAPVFTGDARATTPATSDNDTSIATTAWVKAQYIQNSVVFDPPSQATNVVGVIQTLSMTGAALGDYCVASFSVDLNGMILIAWVSSANTVKFQFQNKTAGTLDLASGTVRVRVWKQ